MEDDENYNDDEELLDDDSDDEELDDDGELEEDTEDEEGEQQQSFNNVERDVGADYNGFSHGQNKYNQADIERINNRGKYEFGNQGVTDNNPGSNNPNGGKPTQGGTEKPEGLDSKKDLASDKTKDAAGKATDAAADKAKDAAADKAKDAAADKAKEAVADKAKEEAAKKVKEEAAKKATEAAAKKAAESAASSGGLVLKIKIIFWAVVIALAILFVIASICSIVFVIEEALGLDDYIDKTEEPEEGGGGSEEPLPEDPVEDKAYFPIGSETTTTSGDETYADGNPPEAQIVKNYGLQADGTMHYGIDIVVGNVAGVDNVIAVDDGIVVATYTECNTCAITGALSDNIKLTYVSNTTCETCGYGYGNYIRIAHKNGSYTLYAHLHPSSIVLKVGDEVKKGQLIGKIGSTGTDTPHLHFEYFTDVNTRADPNGYVNIDEPRPNALINIRFVQGKNNKQTCCLTLLKSGFSKEAVAGMLSNINSESGFRTDIPGDNGTSNGICQWHNERLTNLKNYCGSKALTSISCQLDFLVAELKTRSEYKYLTSEHSAYDMGYQFCYQFERPAKKETSCINRGNAAKKTYMSYVENGCE